MYHYLKRSVSETGKRSEKKFPRTDPYAGRRTVSCVKIERFPPERNFLRVSKNVGVNPAISSDRTEGMVTDQPCRIVVGISSQIGRDGHGDMGDVSTYGKIIRFDETSRFESLCRYLEIQYLRASQRVKTERELH